MAPENDHGGHARPGGPNIWPDGPSAAARAAMSAGPAAPVTAPPSSRRAVRTLSGLLALLVAAAVALPVLGGRAPDPAAALVAAVDSTLGRHTSDLSLQATVSAGSQALAMTGTGQVDYAGHRLSLDVTAHGPGSSPTAGGAASLHVRELLLGGTLYEQVPGMGSVAPGKSWVSLGLATVGASGAAASPTGGWGAAANPLDLLPLLQKTGGTVQALGQSTQGGQTVTGYRVTWDRTALASQLAKADLPSYLRAAQSSLDLGGMTLTLEVAGTGLLSSLAVDLHGTAGGSAFSMTLDMAFSTFGTAVDISAPPATQVLTFRQFLPQATSPAASLPA